jgi:hypothetical protein
MGGSLVGKSEATVRAWATWYLKQRGLIGVTAAQLIDAARSEQGTTPAVTKTKLRRAATRLLRNARMS